MGRWFVNQGDAIRANLISSAAVGITVFITILTPDGEYRRVRSNVPFTTNGTRVAETAVILISTLPEGEILSMNIATFTTSVKRGQCYVQSYVIEQPTMAAGYVFANHDVLLGDNVDPGPAGGHGNIRSISLGDPAANTQLTAQTVPTNAMWLVRSVHAPETAAGAATRAWQVRYTDGTNILYTGAAPQELTGVITTLEACLGGVVVSNVNSLEDMTALPWIYLLAGYTFQPFLNNIAAADDIGASFMQVEEWLVL